MTTEVAVCCFKKITTSQYVHPEGDMIMIASVKSFQLFGNRRLLSMMKSGRPMQTFDLIHSQKVVIFIEFSNSIFEFYNWQANQLYPLEYFLIALK